MKALLLGGTGFIGSMLSQALLAHGHDVVSVSRSGQGDPPGVTSLALDLTQEPCPLTLLTETDTVFILLGQKHRDFNPTNELAIITTLAKQLSAIACRVVFFSSVMVYGDTPTPAQETNPCQPIETYAHYKLASEAALQAQVPPERLTILRLSNVYGTPSNRGFIGLLMEQAREPAPAIRLAGNGEQKRDYLFVDDLIRAIIAVVTHPTARGVVNIATGTSYTLQEVVTAVAEVTNQPIAVTVTHQSVNEPQNSLIDNTRLQTVFGYTHFTPLRQGLQQTLTRYQEKSR